MINAPSSDVPDIIGVLLIDSPDSGFVIIGADAIVSILIETLLEAGDKLFAASMAFAVML
jgi:hypothetical protein